MKKLVFIFCLFHFCFLIAQKTIIDIEGALVKKSFLQADTLVTNFLARSQKQNGVSSESFRKDQLLIGDIYYKYGFIDKACELYWNVSLITRELSGENNELYIEDINRVAYIYELKGNYVTANKMYQENYSSAKVLSGKESVIYAAQLDNLGRMSEIRDDYEAAESYYIRSSEILASSGEDGSLVFAHNLADQAHLYYLLGSYTASEALFRQSKYIYESHDFIHEAEYAYTLRFLAQLDVKLNNTVEAILLLNQALDIYSKVYCQNHPEYAHTLRDLAGVYLGTQHYDQCEELINKCLSIFEQTYGIEHLEYLATQALRGELYAAQNKTLESDSLIGQVLNYYEEYLGVDHLNYAEIELIHAKIKYSEGNYEDAIGINQRVVELYKQKLDPLHPKYAETINNLALLYWASGDNKRAYKFYEQNITNYVRQYKRYFPFLSEKEKGYFYDGIQLFFEEFNSFAIGQVNSNPEILGLMYNAEIATKSLLYHTSKEIRDHIGDNDVLINRYQRWVQVKELLAKISKLDKSELEKRGVDVEALESTANYLEKEISLRVEKEKEKEGTVFDVKWEDIRDYLQEGEAAVEIFQFDYFSPDSGGVFENKSFYAALIITPQTKQHPELILLKNGHFLESEALQSYKNFIQYQITDKVNFDHYLKPILDSDYLKNIKKIYFSPDGVYNQINLNTLFNKEKGVFVLDQLDLHFLANTKDILEVDEHILTDKDFQSGNFSSVLFGFADFHMNPFDDTESDSKHHIASESLLTRGGVGELFRGGDGIAELPGTKIEIESIEEIFSSHKGVVSKYMGATANEATFKSIDSPSILHVATHGFFMKDKEIESRGAIDSTTRGGVSIPELEHEENPLMRSGIMLASARYAYSEQTLKREIEAVLKGDQVEDGILTAYEAMNLDLSNTELVVLSACETGLGVVKNGEGVYGLQRSLQTAGAKSIVMSLWKVSDEATQKFMIHFYKEWFRVGNKRLAFIKAQQLTREEYKKPYYWGAFVLVGH